MGGIGFKAGTLFGGTLRYDVRDVLLLLLLSNLKVSSSIGEKQVY